MPLTRKQKWRIDKVQSEKIARADKAALKVESQIHDDDDEYPGIVITRYGQRQLVEAENGDLFQSVSRQILASLLQVIGFYFKKQNIMKPLLLLFILGKLSSKDKISSLLQILINYGWLLLQNHTTNMNSLIVILLWLKILNYR